jgi:hypothetical protein
VAIDGQPIDVVADPVAPGFDPAEVGVDCLEEVGGLCLGRLDEQRNLVGQAGLVVLQGKKIIGAAVEDGLGDSGLAADGIDGNQRAGQMQPLQQ